MENIEALDGGYVSKSASVDGMRPQRLIRLAEVQQRVGLSRASIYKRMSEGKFPKSTSLGARCAVWIESEIDDWIAVVAAMSRR
jgi:prophage regulatory protein